jgi:hypothetical protein
MFKILRQTFVNGFLVKERIVTTMEEHERYTREVVQNYGDECRTEDFDMLRLITEM